MDYLVKTDKGYIWYAFKDEYAYTKDRSKAKRYSYSGAERIKSKLIKEGVNVKVVVV